MASRCKLGKSFLVKGQETSGWQRTETASLRSASLTPLRLARCAQCQGQTTLTREPPVLCWV
eukprot:scaffold436075_cov35-Prasinocladus_malaysianus.AAC.1